VTVPVNDVRVSDILKEYDGVGISGRKAVSKMLLTENGIAMRYISLLHSQEYLLIIIVSQVKRL
jgi:hypothetical protein